MPTKVESAAPHHLWQVPVSPNYGLSSIHLDNGAIGHLTAHQNAEGILALLIQEDKALSLRVLALTFHL